MKRGESSIVAACRELDEETGLKVLNSSHLFDYESPSQHHHVCLISAEGNVNLRQVELGDFRWRDGLTQLTIIPSATEIIGLATAGGYLKIGSNALTKSLV